MRLCLLYKGMDNFEDTPPIDPFSPPEDGSLVPSGETTALADPGLSLRQPPKNIEVEQGLLGALLTNNMAFERVSDFLQPEHFAEPVHGRIFAAIQALIEKGEIADAARLKTMFDQDGALEEIGGGRYLGELQASVVSIINATDYARTIYDMHLRRQLIDLGEVVVNEAFSIDLENPPMQQIERAEEQLYSLADKGEIENGPKAFKNILTSTVAIIDAAVSRDGDYTGIPSGFTDLDKKLGGLNRSDLIILAARPAMGKTALVTNMAFNAAQKAGGKIAFFSLEMASEQLATRMLSEQTGISSEVIRKGEINKDQFGTIYNVARELETLDFFIDDTPALPVAALRTRARRLKRQYGGLDLIVVDYLQLMQGRSGGSENRVQEISEITRGLKGIAQELDVPVIALSQLSRQVENRDDKRPQLADLRESGSIEQDADVVLFIYREAYYEQNKMPIKKGEEDESTFASRMDAWQNHMETIHNQASVIISKNRHGPTGDVTLYFDGSTTKFSDYVPDDRYAGSPGY